MMAVRLNVCAFLVATVEGRRFIQTVTDGDGRLSCVAGRVELGEGVGECDAFVGRAKELTGLSGWERGVKVDFVDREKSGIVEKDKGVRTELVVLDIGSCSMEGIGSIRCTKKQSLWMDLERMMGQVSVCREDNGWMDVRLGSGFDSIGVRVTSYIVMAGIQSGNLRVKR